MLWYKNISSSGKDGHTRKLLHEDARRLFANKQFLCAEYRSNEREIYDPESNTTKRRSLRNTVYILSLFFFISFVIFLSSRCAGNH